MGRITSEFAAVEVSIDSSGNSPRLRIEDLRSGRVGYLDALELETLAWLPAGALEPLLDPSAVRWGEQPEPPSTAALVGQVYDALADGDRDTLADLLAEDFCAEFAEGMPVVRPAIRGAQEMIEHGWWALGREMQVRVEPSAWMPCAGGRLLVLGRYAGTARSTGRQFKARLAHLWSAHDGRLVHLWHLTDTAAWAAALEKR